MHLHHKHLTQNTVAFLIILGSPFVFTTKVMSLEKQVEFNEPPLVLKNPIESDNRKYEIKLSGIIQEAQDNSHKLSINSDVIDREKIDSEIISENNLDFIDIQSGHENEILSVNSSGKIATASPSNLQEKIEPKTQDDFNQSNNRINLPDSGLSLSSSGLAIKNNFILTKNTELSNEDTNTYIYSGSQNINSNIFSSKPNQDKKESIVESGVDSILKEGDRYLSEGDYEKSRLIFNKALGKSQETSNFLGIAKSYSGQATVELSSRKYDKAQDSIMRGLVALQKIVKKHPDVEADLLLLQGYVYLGEEKRPALEGLIKQVQPIIYELTESEKRSALLLTLADLQYAVGRKESGNQSAQQAVNFLQKTPDPSKAIFVLSKLALSQFNSEKSNETLKTLDYISELVEKIKDNPNKPSFLQSIGGLYLKLAEIEDLKVTKLQEKSKTAIALFGKAKQLFQKSEQISTPQDRKTEAYAKNLLTFGRAYLGLRENEEAIEKAKQSIEIIKELEKNAGIPEPKQKKRSIECWAFGWIVSSICDNNEEEDNTESAILNQSHITFKRMRRDARDIMAAAQLDQGRYSESDINLREALKITREIDERLKDYSKTIRMINGIAGIIAMLPLGPISDFGSYINMNTGSLDQLIMLPQGGFSILDRINLELINKSKKYNLSDLEKSRKKHVQIMMPVEKLKLHSKLVQAIWQLEDFVMQVKHLKMLQIYLIRFIDFNSLSKMEKKSGLLGKQKPG